jgi:glycosyltransferase involved in cell wall biosynthesis
MRATTGQPGRADRHGDDAPLVSILTPSFNQGQFLGDCLASVATQTYPRIEHIVCDGGSTDGTLDVLERAGSHVLWVSEPDRGQSQALNKAFRLSSGSILGWLNSDDAYFGPTAVADAVDLFERRPEVDVVYGHSALVNADGLILHLLWSPPFSYRLLHTTNFIIQPTVFIRRAAVQETLVDESYDHSMDRELWLRLGRRVRFARLDGVVAIDRHHENRKVYTRTDLARADDARLVEKYGSIPSGRRRGRTKAVRVVQRLLAVRLLGSTRQQLVFEGHVDSRAKLLIRQLALPRRKMPIGGQR